MQSVLSNLPVGWRFHPTNEELLDHYLKKKNLGLPIDGFDIQELQICNFDPWDLLDDKSPSKERYFFCCREFYSKTGAAKRKRKAGAGFWKRTGEIQSLTSEDSDELIGTKTIFVYHDPNPTKWVIHEYEYTAQLNSPIEGDFVVCKLMINKKKTNKCKSTQLHCVKNKPSKKERKGLANCKNKPNQKGKKGVAHCKATSTSDSECQNSLKKNVCSTSGDAEPSSIKYSIPDFEKQNPDEITATLTSEKGQSSFPMYSVFASQNKDPNPHETETFARNFTNPCNSNNPKLCQIDPFSTVFANLNNLQPHEHDPLFVNPTSPCNSNTKPCEVDLFSIVLANSDNLQGIFTNPCDSNITEPCGNFHPHETDHLSNVINPCHSKPCGNLHPHENDHLPDFSNPCHLKITEPCGNFHPHENDHLTKFLNPCYSKMSTPCETLHPHENTKFLNPCYSKMLTPCGNLHPHCHSKITKRYDSDSLAGNFTVHTGSKNSNPLEFEHFSIPSNSEILKPPEINPFSIGFSIPSDSEILKSLETNPFAIGFSIPSDSENINLYDKSIVAKSYTVTFESTNSNPHEMHTFSTLKRNENYTNSLYKQSKPSCLGPFVLENESPWEPTSVSMQNKGETNCFVESSYFEMNGKPSYENQDPSKTKFISAFSEGEWRMFHKMPSDFENQNLNESTDVSVLQYNWSDSKAYNAHATAFQEFENQICTVDMPILTGYEGPLTDYDVEGCALSKVDFNYWNN